jgi:hypothetical protein
MAHRLFVPLFLILFLLPTTARADLELTAGFTVVQLAPKRSWSMDRLEIRGRSVIDFESGNGVVIQFSNGAWSGEGHGNELLESVSLTVDGVEVPVSDHLGYSGTILVLSRTVVLDGSIRVRHQLVVSPDGVDQHFSLSGLDPGRGIALTYVASETRSNRLTQVTIRHGEETLGTALTDRDDRLFYRPAVGTSADTIVQVDPQGGFGILTRWVADPAVAVTPWVWDRPTDNKLYLVATRYTDAGSDMDLSQTIRFCAAEQCNP